MLERLEASIAKDKEQGLLTPLQEAQYAVQIDWLRKGEVPGLETLLMSKGYIAPEAGKSYFLLMTGVQVCGSACGWRRILLALIALP